MEEFEKTHTPVIFLPNPFGDTPQGKLLTQMQGMSAEYARAQIAERTRRGRLAQARCGAFMPWAYRCDGDRDLPTCHGCAPQVLSAPLAAEVVRASHRTLVAEPLSWRPITTRLNAANTPTPTGTNAVWQSATGRNIRTHRLYAGQARDHYRRPVIPKSRKPDAHHLRSLNTGRSSRAESEGMWSDAPAMIPAELFAKAPWQLRRNADTARKRYQPGSRR